MRNVNIILVMLLFFAGISGYTRGQDKSDAQRKAIFVNVAHIFDKGDVNQLDKYVSDNAVDHQMDTSVTKKTGLAGLKDYFNYSHRVFPDMMTTIHSIAVSGDTLFAYFTSAGTTSEPYMGMPANKKLMYSGVDIVRFSGNKIVEHWGFMDTNDMNKMMQMMSDKNK